MCIQDISWICTHHSLITTKNANVWGISKYHIFCEGQIKMARCKKIKLRFRMHPLQTNMISKHLNEVM